MKTAASGLRGRALRRAPASTAATPLRRSGHRGRAAEDRPAARRCRRSASGNDAERRAGRDHHRHLPRDRSECPVKLGRHAADARAAPRGPGRASRSRPLPARPGPFRARPSRTPTRGSRSPRSGPMRPVRGVIRTSPFSTEPRSPAVSMNASASSRRLFQASTGGDHAPTEDDQRAVAPRGVGCRDRERVGEVPWSVGVGVIGLSHGTGQHDRRVAVEQGVGQEGGVLEGRRAVGHHHASRLRFASQVAGAAGNRDHLGGRERPARTRVDGGRAELEAGGHRGHQAAQLVGAERGCAASGVADRSSSRSCRRS